MANQYYVGNMDAVFTDIGDALRAAAEEAIRTREEQPVSVSTGIQYYTYCWVRRGDQA